MSFNYDELKAKDESGGFWASYSDLFMVLSLVFLLLYVVAGLRSGTSSIQQSIEYEQLKKENADFKQQLRTYNTLKDNYISTGATKNEVEDYNKLMKKLDLLQDEATEEKKKLRQAARENEQKATALNKYQQMIRNIVNNNMISSARRKRQDRVLVKQDKVIQNKKNEIKDLNRTVAMKEEQIEKGEKQIKSVTSKLDKSIARLKKQYKQQKISKQKMLARIAKVKKDTRRKVKKLKSQNQNIAAELDQAQDQIEVAQNEIEQKQREINEQDDVISDLEKQKVEKAKEIAQMRDDFDEQQAQAKREFNDQLKRQKLSARARAKKIAEFRSKLQAEKNALDQEVAALAGEVEASKNKLNQTKTELAQAERATASAQAQAQKLKTEKAQISEDLKDAEKKLNARKILIERIKNNLRNAGVEASVDPKSGDVVISFGDEYFDTGKATLKPNMVRILKKFMPAYSKSLLSDPKTADKVKSVELVGFSSPTYRGKYVDPVSLKAADRKAANYNLDLSYYRAKSIQNYIFDTSRMKYEYQKKLLPLVKVTGRSFFAEGVDRDVASSMTQREYCAKYDCKKAQRVIIKFDLED